MSTNANISIFTYFLSLTSFHILQFHLLYSETFFYFSLNYRLGPGIPIWVIIFTFQIHLHIFSHIFSSTRISINYKKTTKISSQTTLLNTPNLEDFRGITLPLSFELELMMLYVRISALSIDYGSLIDGLLWGCPKQLPLPTGLKSRKKCIKVWFFFH